MKHLHEFKEGNFVHYRLQSGDTSRKLAVIERIHSAEEGDRVFDLKLQPRGEEVKFIESDREASVSGIRFTPEIIQSLDFKAFPKEGFWSDGLLEMVPPDNNWVISPNGIPHYPDMGMKLRQKGQLDFLGTSEGDIEIHYVHELQNIYAKRKFPLNIENLK